MTSLGAAVRRMHARIVVVLAVALLSACCAEPAFLGIPDAAHRSRDVALPLSAEDRQHLLDVLEVGTLPPRHFQRDDSHPARKAVAAEYAGILDQLAKAQRPTREDLAATGRIGALAVSPDLVIAVHDARAMELGAHEARAVVVGDYAFALYVARPVRVHVPEQDEVQAWRFDADGDQATYKAVTVCHRNHWHH